LPTFINRVLRFFLRLALGLLALLVTLGLLFAGLVFLVLALLRGLVTGQKPARPVMFARFQRFSSQDIWPSANMRKPQPRETDIVDVEIREIDDRKRLP
jgi:hypothetical protein